MDDYLGDPTDGNLPDFYSVSITGTSHVRAGKKGEDSVSRFCMNGITALAVCDGAGSAKYGKNGAAVCALTAARVAAGYFERLYAASDESRAKMIMRYVLKAMFLEAARLSTDIHNLACTLMVAAVTPSGDRAFFVHVGDGLIIARKKHTNETVLLSRYRHEFRNLTCMITNKEQQYTSGILQDISGILLVTDGTPESIMIDSSGKPKKTAQLMLSLPDILPSDKMIYNEYHAFAKEIQKKCSGDDISIASLIVSDKQAPQTEKAGAGSPKRRRGHSVRTWHRKPVPAFSSVRIQRRMTDDRLLCPRNG